MNNNNNDQDHEFYLKKEQELKEREHAIRLREMEAELYQDKIPFHQTEKLEKQEGKFKTTLTKIVNIAKFLGIVILVIVAVKIAYWVALAVLVTAVSWVAYKIFFQKKD